MAPMLKAAKDHLAKTAGVVDGMFKELDDRVVQRRTKYITGGMPFADATTQRTDVGERTKVALVIQALQAYANTHQAKKLPGVEEDKRMIGREKAEQNMGKQAGFFSKPDPWTDYSIANQYVYNRASHEGLSYGLKPGRKADPEHFRRFVSEPDAQKKVKILSEKFDTRWMGDAPHEYILRHRAGWSATTAEEKKMLNGVRQHLTRIGKEYNASLKKQATHILADEATPEVYPVTVSQGKTVLNAAKALLEKTALTPQLATRAESKAVQVANKFEGFFQHTNKLQKPELAAKYKNLTNKKFRQAALFASYEKKANAPDPFGMESGTTTKFQETTPIATEVPKTKPLQTNKQFAKSVLARTATGAMLGAGGTGLAWQYMHPSNTNLPWKAVGIGGAAGAALLAAARLGKGKVPVEDWNKKAAAELVHKGKDGMSHKAGTTASDVCPKELKAGIKVEREHSSDPRVQKEIALDHLTEFPRYYTALAKMEKELKQQEKKANIAEIAAQAVRDGDYLKGMQALAKKRPASFNNASQEVVHRLAKDHLLSLTKNAFTGGFTDQTAPASSLEAMNNMAATASAPFESPMTLAAPKEIRNKTPLRNPAKLAQDLIKKIGK